MEKLDFSKLKQASSSLGERIKSGGAHMGRTLSSKVKELLQAPTPESKIVDEATARPTAAPDWGLNFRICGMVGRGELDCAAIVRAVKRKLPAGGDPAGQGLSLDLLDALASNCEGVLPVVASEKVLKDMASLIEDPGTEQGVKLRTMQLIRAWGVSDDLEHLPVFRQTYMAATREDDHDLFPPTLYDLESYLGQARPTPPETTHPVDDERDAAVILGHDFESVEERNELLAKARDSLDIISAILKSDVERKPEKDELIASMLEKCSRYFLPNLRRIIESTSDIDESMLFDALNLHDELQLLVPRHTHLIISSTTEKETPGYI